MRRRSKRPKTNDADVDKAESGRKESNVGEEKKDEGTNKTKQGKASCEGLQCNQKKGGNRSMEKTTNGSMSIIKDQVGPSLTDKEWLSP